VLVNLLGVPVFPEHSPEHPLPPHPHHLEWQPSVGSTSPLTNTGVTALSHGLLASFHPGATVDLVRELHHIPVLDLLLDVGTAVGQSDLTDLTGVDPYLPLSALKHGGSEALLKTESDHFCNILTVGTWVRKMIEKKGFWVVFWMVCGYSA